MPYPSYFCRIPKLDDEENTDQCLLGVANSLMGFFDEHLIMSSEDQTAKYKVRDTKRNLTVPIQLFTFLQKTIMRKLFAAVEDRFAADLESGMSRDEKEGTAIYRSAVDKLIEFEKEVGVERGERLHRLHKELTARQESDIKLMAGHVEHLRSMQSQVNSILRQSIMVPMRNHSKRNLT